MDVRQSYNLWADRYDSVENKTRDLEGVALCKTLGNLRVEACLEIGCGTGKNTQWLSTRCKQVLAVDFSEEMLAHARAKVSARNVIFREGDITQPWSFPGRYDLITFSLVLEHVEDLEAVFLQTSKNLAHGGIVYVGELHPFKQYCGSKARFETDQGEHVVAHFKHHVSDFVRAAKGAGLRLVDMDEHFDGCDQEGIPRILTMLFTL